MKNQKCSDLQYKIFENKKVKMVANQYESNIKIPIFL